MENKTFSRVRVFFFIIFLFVIFLGSLDFISCEEINVDYPGIVNSSEEFSFNLKIVDFELDVYDVKIDVLDKNNSERIAKIQNNGEWKSTYYYISRAINLSEDDENTFFLKTIREFEEADIEIKIRDSKGNVNSFFNYSLKMSNKEDEEENGEDDGEDDGKDEKDYNNDNESEDNSKEYDNDESAQTDSIYYKIPASDKNTTNSNNKITAPIIKIKRNEEKENAKSIKTESNYALYGLGVFSILIILLMLIKFKIKSKNEFR